MLFRTIFLAGLAMTASAQAQQVDFVIPSSGPGEVVGARVSAVGDVDDDGYDDIALLSYSPPTVEVWSLRTQSLIWETSESDVGVPPSSGFGSTIEAAGDLNGDGHDDLIVGSPREAVGILDEGTVQILSGLDGSLLREHISNQRFANFGARATSLGDVDGDTVPDYVISAPYYSVVTVGRAMAFSGVDGSVLYQLTGPPNSEDFGYDLVRLSDYTGDGIDEFSIATQYMSGTPVTRHLLIHGATGDFLTGFAADTARVRPAGDFDGDSVHDIVAMYPDEHPTPGFKGKGAFRVLSGADASELLVVSGSFIGESLGQEVVAMGDVDGDGITDFATSCAGGIHDPPWDVEGGAHLFSGADGATIWAESGDALDDRFAFDIVSVADGNGDGLTELILGHLGDFASIPSEVLVYSFPPPFVQTLHPNGPGQLDVRTSQLAPSTATYLYASRFGTGSTVISSLGITLDLDRGKRVAGPTQSDPVGAATWSFAIPNHLQGRFVWVQAAQAGTTTNVCLVHLLD